MESQKNRHAGLLFIGGLKLVKAIVLMAVALGALSLLHKNAQAEIEHWVEAIRLDPRNRYIDKVLAQAGLLNDQKLETISVGTFAYASLFAVEGFGLLKRKTWAEYLTIVATASFIPIEVYETAERYSTAKIVGTAVNVLVVAYLVVRVARDRRERARGG